MAIQNMIRYLGVILLLTQATVVFSNCILSMKLDLTNNQPLIISTTNYNWYSLQNSPKGIIQLSRDETVKLICPSSPAIQNSFSNIANKNEIVAKCTNGNKFQVDGKLYSFDKLQCTTPVQSSIQKTGRACLGSNTELIKVGYQGLNNFLTVYEVCFNKENKGTLYSEVVISPHLEKNDAPPRIGTWEMDSSIYGNIDLDSLYTCNKQAETFKKIISKDFLKDNDKCCLDKTQLVSNTDVAFGTQQLATFNYLNTVPQWSTCNKENWREVENRIRALSKSLQTPLTVWTGTFRILELRAKWSIFHKDIYINYNSKSDKSVPVPLYIWKVVFDYQSRNGLAIIEVNHPKSDLSSIDSYILCEDICHNVNWMNFLGRKTIRTGYVYCCDLKDFEFAFQFKSDTFPRGGILRDTKG